MSDDHRTLDWAVEIIGMCEPIRCHQGGMWFSRNHNFADATFVDYGAADAFAAAAKALPALLKVLREARRFVENDPTSLTSSSLLIQINEVLLDPVGGRKP